MVVVIKRVTRCDSVVTVGHSRVCICDHVPQISLSRVDVTSEALRPSNTVLDGWAGTELSSCLFIEVRGHC